MKRIHQYQTNTIRILNLDNNSLYDADPSKVVIVAETFYICSTFHTTKENHLLHWYLGEILLYQLSIYYNKIRYANRDKHQWIKTPND